MLLLHNIYIIQLSTYNVYSNLLTLYSITSIIHIYVYIYIYIYIYIYVYIFKYTFPFVWEYNIANSNCNQKCAGNL